MNVKIIYDQEENDYVCFIAGATNVTGYGKTEKDAVLDFLVHCKDNPKFNQKIINGLIQNIS